MGAVSDGGVRRAFLVAGELAQLRDLSEFPGCAARSLRALIACDHAGYNVIDVPSGRATVVADPADVVFDGGPEVLAEFGDQNPLIPAARAGGAATLRLSDVISRRELHRTELYNYVYRRIGLEYQLATPLPAPGRALGRPGEIVGLSLARRERDFIDGEKELLDLARPHFAAALERLHAVALTRAMVSASEGNGRWLVLVDPGDACVAWTSTDATRAFGVTAGHALPAPLRRWVRSESARRAPGPRPPAARIAVGSHRLRCRLVPDAYPQLHALHLELEPEPDGSALRSLGLTRRQAEVLALALEGDTAAGIAERLCLSSRTVEKHFEAIYYRLGVANRAQAVLAAAAAVGR